MCSVRIRGGLEWPLIIENYGASRTFQKVLPSGILAGDSLVCSAKNNRPKLAPRIIEEERGSGFKTSKNTPQDIQCLTAEVAVPHALLIPYNEPLKTPEKRHLDQLKPFRSTIGPPQTARSESPSNALKPSIPAHGYNLRRK
ncbi:unnamed protein product [Bursaphelenchus xylophilus]|uniref:(pine wood nematode) hypothetical protein n=1 Tax=Bursaphelenchus xylophilus TaxID=6326 RepID=A0A1I7RX57_BURXY|nr:unnamed protein product [Bursaphelenchus xylophilus]CAG9121339.1 unnamed protein product [Bursaphelenchus xylophilus]